MEEKKRIDLQNNVTQQLQSVIAEKLSNIFTGEYTSASTVFDNLVENGFISISPPLEKPPVMQFLTMDSLRNYTDGKSIKPGNILLNMRKLIESLPEVVTIRAGMVCDNNIVTICGALSLCLKLSDIATINISKEQAFVIVALWRNCDFDHKISLDDGFLSTNNLLKQYGEPDFTSLKYNIIIDSLIKIKCIELTEEIIWLRERISKNYIYGI